MEYRTVTGVELAAVGMEWHAASGDEAFTFENLADAVEAANNDPHILDPRIRLGHTSDLNEGEGYDPFEALGDAEPAFGRVVNLRLTNDGAMLVGDFIEVPEWLADAMPSAYPNRSVQARRMVVTEGSKSYSMVLTAVALLGPIEPAVKTLDDLERLLVDGPDAVAASNPNPEEGRMSETVAASVDVNTIRERFNFDWAMSEPIDGLDTYYWWAISVRVDPNEVIAETPEGELYAVTWKTDGKDEITFEGEPTRVREEFVPVAASATSVVAKLRDRKDQRVLASNLERPEKPAPKTAASSQPDPQEDEMDIDLAALRGRLGLPDDATEEQINEALAKEPETPEAPETPATPTDEIPETPEVEAPDPVAASAELPEGFVAVPADKWEQVQAGAIAGGELASTTETGKRDDTFVEACKDGKVAPADKAGLYTMHANPETRERFYTLLTAEVKDGGLAKGLVPVSELGEAGGDEVSASAGLPEIWFPELNNKEEK